MTSDTRGLVDKAIKLINFGNKFGRNKWSIDISIIQVIIKKTLNFLRYLLKFVKNLDE